MDLQFLADRILKDARAEARGIVSDTRTRCKENIEYARRHANEVIADARATAKKQSEREGEITQGARELRARLDILRQKTAVVGRVFDEAMDAVKYNFRVERHKDYEVRLTREELAADLRGQIEREVVEILFG